MDTVPHTLSHCQSRLLLNLLEPERNNGHLDSTAPNSIPALQPLESRPSGSQPKAKLTTPRTHYRLISRIPDVADAHLRPLTSSQTGLAHRMSVVTKPTKRS